MCSSDLVQSRVGSQKAACQEEKESGSTGGYSIEKHRAETQVIGWLFAGHTVASISVTLMHDSFGTSQFPRPFVV